MSPCRTKGTTRFTVNAISVITISAPLFVILMVTGTFVSPGEMRLGMVPVMVIPQAEPTVASAQAASVMKLNNRLFRLR